MEVKKRFIVSIFAAIVSVFAITDMAFSAGLDNGPWPMFMNNTKHNALSKYKAFDFPLIKWKKNVNFSRLYWASCSPVISSDDNILIVSDKLYAINLDGSTEWMYNSYTNNSFIGSPAISEDGTIYLGSSGNIVYAINSDGTEKWMYIGNRYETYNSSPAIGSDGTIYLSSRYYSDAYSCGHLNAFDQQGNFLWSRQVGDYTYSSPAVDSDGTIYVGSPTDLYSFQNNGDLNWKYPIVEKTSYNQNSPAIGDDGTVYITSHNNIDCILYAINKDGTLKWSYQFNEENNHVYIYSTPAIYSDGTLYIGASHGLYSINNSGQLNWKLTTIWQIISSPIIDSDGIIYVTSRDNGVYAIKQDGTLKWKYDTQDEMNSMPIIGSDGTLYFLSNDNYLYATGINDDESGLFGFVVDMATGEPIDGATLSVDSTSTQTNDRGVWALNLLPNTYNILCNKDGYQEIIVGDVSLVKGEVITLNIELTTPGPLNITTTTLPSAETTVEYNARVRITGGIYPYTYNVVDGYGILPPGLSIDPENGTISGTPTTPGAYSFCISVEDSEGAYSEECYTIEVTEKLGITTEDTFPRGTKGTAYFETIEASGGTLPNTFSHISGTLPPGLSLSSDGSLEGTPTTTGAYDFTVRVTDASARTDEKTFHLEIVDPLVISTSILNNGIVGEAYEQPLSSTGGYGDHIWIVYTGTLPAGLSLDNATGIISGTPTESTNRTVVFAVSDEENRVTYKDLTIQVCDPLQIVTTALPEGLVDTLYSEAIRLDGGIGPFSFTLDGILPDGLSFNTSTGVISGTPTSRTFKNIVVTVTDSTYPTNQTATKTLSIRTQNILTITTSAVLPNCKKDVAMNPVILQAGGGPSPYTWAIIDGQMPSGITLNPSTGQLSGTPEDRGDFVFTIQVTDNNTDIAEKEFTIRVLDDLLIVTGAIPDGALGKSFSHTLEADGGLKPYSWRLTNGTLPAGLNISSTTGTIYGTPTTTQTNTSFTIEVSDDDSPAQTAQHTYTMNILDELFIYTQTIPNCRVNQAYSATFTAQLGVPPYTWGLESGVLPPGLTLSFSPTVATLEGTPTETGTFTFSLEVSDEGTPVQTKVKEYTIIIYDEVVIETSELPDAIRNESYAESIVVSGGALPYTWQLIAGDLPTGLSLNSTTGLISGITHEISGTSKEFTVRVTDSGNPSGFADKELSLFVFFPLTINTETIQMGLQKAPFTATFDGEGGISPHTWSIAAGSLPDGLTIDPDTGIISGTIEDCGTFDFTLRLTDSAELPNTITKAFQLEVVCSDDYTITGNVGGLAGVTVTLEGVSSTTTDADGTYSFENLASGDYTLTPALDGYRFEPSSMAVSLTHDLSGLDFTPFVNSAPNTPSDPTPANTATGIATDFELTWNGGDPDAGDTVTYDVYFGTESAPPLVISQQSETSFNPGQLVINTTYYWQIVAHDNYGAQTQSPIWSFTTVAPGQIQFDPSAYSVTEAQGLAQITLTRTGGSDGEVSVTLTTGSGSASAGFDYTAVSEPVVFANGETTTTYNITIVNDGRLEGDETVSLSLSDPTGGASLGTTTSAVLTIQDDDEDVIEGDIDGNGEVDLMDLIITMQILSGEVPYTEVYEGGDINGDGRIGIEEVIFMLREIAE